MKKLTELLYSEHISKPVIIPKALVTYLNKLIGIKKNCSNQLQLARDSFAEHSVMLVLYTC